MVKETSYTKIRHRNTMSSQEYLHLIPPADSHHHKIGCGQPEEKIVSASFHLPQGHKVVKLVQGEAEQSEWSIIPVNPLLEMLLFFSSGISQT
ncbi:hypothetical protein NPIL_290751 [Nephila pilipes]|uniref:Uncharacterized protein n=1 Tax=Nephila pilipes TaxID=299642 RepID=A0A8X6UR78_NEPPI|nr:hypothetical protein NPIL_290751 [Nephila pilipes]